MLAKCIHKGTLIAQYLAPIQAADLVSNDLPGLELGIVQSKSPDAFHPDISSGYQSFAHQGIPQYPHPEGRIP